MRFLGSVAVALFLALPAASASAADYCVLPETSCTPGNRFASVQTALSSAQGPGADRVLIGAGTFSVPTGGLTYNGDRVEIIGAGPAATVLDEPTTAATETALTVTHSGSGRSVLRGLGVRIGAVGPPASNPNTGIKARGGVDVGDIRATSDTTSWGIDLDDASTLSSSRVALPLGVASVGVAALAGTSGSAQVSDSTIQAGIGALNNNTELRVARTTLTASIFGVTASRGPIFVDNAIVEMTDDAPAGAYAFGAVPTTGSSYVEVRNSTAVGGNSGTLGVRAAGAGGVPATAVVTNSIVRTPGVSLQRRGEAGGAADITANHNAFHPAAVVDDQGGPGSIVNLASRTDDPLFLGDAALGQYRLRHDSPLIDAGNPGSPPTPTTDFEGDPRTVDGNGDGNAVRDLGAYEYQRRAPTVTAAAPPGTAFPGDPITWTASGSDADGDPITYAWSWDDGATGNGASVTHAFTPLGSHSGTVTARDATGLTATAGANTTVTARPEGPGGGGGGGGTDADRIGPRFSIARRVLKLSAKNVIPVRLTCDRGEAEPCAGTLKLASAKKVVRKKRTLSLGRAAFSIAPGKSATVKVKVSKRTAARARRLRRLRVKATAVARDKAGNQATKTGSLMLSAPPQKRKR